jgi:WD40 repeat protein
VAGTRLYDSWETRGNLLATLQRTPNLVAAAGFDDGDRILAMALRADGHELAVGTSTGQIRVYDPATMRVVANLTRPDRRSIYGLQYRADGALIAWGDRPVAPTTSSVQVWDVHQKRQLAAPQVSGALRGGAVSRDGNLVVIARRMSGVVRIGTYGSITPLGVTALDNNAVVVSADLQPRVADSLALSPDGQVLAVGGVLPLTVHDLATGGRRVFGAGFPLAFSPDGSRLASDPGTGDVDIWEVSTGKLLAVARAHAVAVIDAAWSPDGQSLVTCGDDRLVRVWSTPVGKAATPTLVRTFAGHGGRITICRFTPDGSAVYSAGLDGALYLWDVKHESDLGSLVRPGGIGYFRVFSMGPESVVGIDLDDSFVNATLDQVDLRTGESSRAAPMITEPDMFNDFAATPDGATIASVSYSGALSTWSTVDGHRLSGPVRPPLPANLLGSAVGISGDGRTALVALYDRQQTQETRVYRYDLHSHHLGDVMNLPDVVFTFAFSPDGRFAVAGLIDGRALVWRTDTWAQVTVLAGQSTGFTASVLRFSDDGRLLAIGGNQGRPSVWNVGTWSLAWRAETGHNGSTISLAFNRDGQLLVSSGTDAKTFLYDLATGRHLGGAIGPDINLWTYSRFIGGTSTLASLGLDDGSVRQVDIDPASWQRRACLLAGRDLTEAEWQTLVPDQPFQDVCPPPST